MWAGTSADGGWAQGLQRCQGKEGCGQEWLVNRRRNGNVPLCSSTAKQSLGMRTEVSEEWFAIYLKKRELKQKASFFREMLLERESQTAVQNPVWICSVFKYKGKSVDNSCQWDCCLSHFRQRRPSRCSSEILPKCPLAYTQLHHFPVKPFKCCVRNSKMSLSALMEAEERPFCIVLEQLMESSKGACSV